MRKMKFEESVMLDASTDLRETSDGYLVAHPRVARTGIQLYRGHEVGRPDLAEVRVYRPEAEVMSKDLLRSLAHKPVTIEHPDQPITARTWKDLAVGHLGDDIVRDGEFVRVPMMLMDANAIDIVRGGRKQLSVGYTAVLKWGDGKTDGGEEYNAIQTTIRANHVAITHTARGGDKLRMGDRKTKEAKMAKLTVDGIVIDMEDRDAQVIERRITQLEKDVAAAKATAQNDVATAKTEVANATAVSQTKDAEIVTLKQQLADALSPQKRAQAARERHAVEQRAKSLFDAVVIDDTRDDADLRRQVVNARVGEVAKGWNDDMVTASFNTLHVLGDSGNGGGLRHVVNVLQHNNTGGTDPVAAAYAQYDKDLTERWKTAGVRSQ